MRKILAMLFVLLLLAMGFAGCGGGETPASKAPIETEAPDSQDSGDAAPPDSGSPQGVENLVPLNQTITISAENRFGENGHTATIGVDEIWRGAEALALIDDRMIEAESVFVAVLPEEDGKEYMVVRFTFTLDSVVEGNTATSLQMIAHSDTLEPYPTLIGGSLYNRNTFPQLNSIEVSVGETVTGYWVFQINEDDVRPVVSYGSFLADNSDGAWFKLY